MLVKQRAPEKEFYIHEVAKIWQMDSPHPLALPPNATDTLHNNDVIITSNDVILT